MIGSYRVLLCGSFREPFELRPLIKALAAALLQAKDLTIMTGGADRFSDASKVVVDQVLCKEVEEILRGEDLDPATRVLTLLPAFDFPGVTRLKLGKVVTVPNTTVRARRFHMVLNSDAVIAIGGEKATKEIAELAWTANRLLLPIPSSGGAAASLWTELQFRAPDIPFHAGEGFSSPAGSARTS